MCPCECLQHAGVHEACSCEASESGAGGSLPRGATGEKPGAVGQRQLAEGSKAGKTSRDEEDEAAETVTTGPGIATGCRHDIARGTSGKC